MAEKNQKAVVVGAGVMGYRIAQVFAQGGFQVFLIDISREALDRASYLIHSGLKTMAEQEFLEEPVQTIMDRLTFTTSLEKGAKEADVAIEAISEKA